jgi:hypothetical protein
VKRAKRSMNSSVEVHRVTSWMTALSAPTTSVDQSLERRDKALARRRFAAARGTHIRRFSPPPR